MPARLSEPTLAAAGVLSSLGVIMRPNALRIIFGLLLGVLAAFVIGALQPATAPSKAIALSSAFAIRFPPLCRAGSALVDLVMNGPCDG